MNSEIARAKILRAGAGENVALAIARGEEPSAESLRQLAFYEGYLQAVWDAQNGRIDPATAEK